VTRLTSTALISGSRTWKRLEVRRPEQRLQPRESRRRAAGPPDQVRLAAELHVGPRQHGVSTIRFLPSALMAMPRLRWLPASRTLAISTPSSGTFSVLTKSRLRSATRQPECWSDRPVRAPAPQEGQFPRQRHRMQRPAPPNANSVKSRGS
jgi:hypothetical protein